MPAAPALAFTALKAFITESFGIVNCLDELIASSCCQLNNECIHSIQPLCSSPITAPSSLLRVGQPQSYALVLSPHGFCRLCFSLIIARLDPAVPCKSPKQTHAPYTPVAVCAVIRSPADLSWKMEKSPVLTTISG